MFTKLSGTEKRIGDTTAREARAITDEMDISTVSDPQSGTFVVTDRGDEHTVDLQAETCDCEDSRLTLPEGGSEVCAHQHHVRYALRPQDIPDELLPRMDRRLVRAAARYAALGVEDRPPITVEEQAAAVVRDSASESSEDEAEADHADGEAEVLMADGGTVVGDTPQGSGDETTHAPGCDNPDCEGLDSDAERPLLSVECWDEWAAYDEDETIAEAAAGGDAEDDDAEDGVDVEAELEAADDSMPVGAERLRELAELGLGPEAIDL